MPDPFKPVPLGAEAVEAAAKALFNQASGMDRPGHWADESCEVWELLPWDLVADSTREKFCRMAQAVILAFLDAMGAHTERTRETGKPLERICLDWFSIKGPVDE